MNFFIKNSIDAQWGIETDNNSLKSSPFSIIWERNRKLIPFKNHCNATSLWRVAGKKIKVKTVIIFLCKYFINNMTYFRFFIVWFHILVCWGVFLNDFNACTVTTERVSSFVGEIFMKMFWIACELRWSDCPSMKLELRYVILLAGRTRILRISCSLTFKSFESGPPLFLYVFPLFLGAI